jgi:hypothetical protein
MSYTELTRQLLHLKSRARTEAFMASKEYRDVVNEIAQIEAQLKQMDAGLSQFNRPGGSYP